ncbi:hypothetical protein C8R44DRAFT_746594 [Mycena epipterygia]|nr:hypothetical protein C8R44DRAFT_746594 [Mycena epipterygia]
MTLDTYGKHPGISSGISISIPGVYSVMAILMHFLGALWDLRCLSRRRGCGGVADKLKQRGVTRERQCYSAAGGTPECDSQSDSCIEPRYQHQIGCGMGKSSAGLLGLLVSTVHHGPGSRSWAKKAGAPTVHTEVDYVRKFLASLGSDWEGKYRQEEHCVAQWEQDVEGRQHNGPV